MNALNAAAAGVTNAMQMFDRSAVKIAQSSATDIGSVAEAVVAQKQAEVAVAANVAVMKSAKEATGQLLDLFV
ncbi:MULTISPECIES: flagellar hook protein FlgE [Asticcacaulis]|uniref:flagellar hook protein FlgE n=1 Tax=Asticcacaulis TaxID=76890 RepID=UPI001AE5AA5B|nr:MULTISPECIES: flagellar hook protein FlgE [Asticcacaulis]MBP2158729.1 hypothetical protein [Asticcacaulis solisilvae]MDR6799775.1 hypothetical protein [Asticcacaulis sp. BE141]